MDKSTKKLRDEFAGRAMQGIVSYGLLRGEYYAVIAECAYKIADAMLKAREAKND